MDSRLLCPSCNERRDSYFFVESSCICCGVKYCAFCDNLDLTFRKYIPCQEEDCFSCSSGLVCDNETFKIYCIPCKDTLNVNNDYNKDF